MGKYSYCSEEKIKEMIRNKVLLCIDRILTDRETSAEHKIAQLDGVMGMMISVVSEMEADGDA